LLSLNRDENSEGLSILAKSEKLGEFLLPYLKKNPEIDELAKQFRYHYEGGVSYEKVENGFTLTLFYLA
jgi:hypothetical protein